jgi:outer membrane protein TolC
MLIRETLPDGSTNEVEVFDTYDFGPLDDFSFSDDSNFHRIRLEDAIKMALTNSPVVRDLGGLILRAPDAKTTDVDPSRAYLDPRFGEEAALSAFDATYNSQLLFQKNDNLFNNQFIGDEGAFQQDLARYSAGISKIAATGGQFGFKNVIDYELNNSPSNRFNGNGDRSYAYDVSLEAEFRQPLFQGAGTLFNRVAGPNNAPGIYNGVSIARTNTDVALADFETKIRDLISDVENTYWDLYFAYRDLEAKIDARNGAYEIWQNLEANRAEKSAAIIGQAKEQYYRFAAEVEESIHGRLNEGTRTNNGSSSGTFRRIGGVRTAERRFRLIVGMPLNDSKLVVPSDVPSEAVSEFDWQSIRDNALTRRAELRRQRWVLKRRELELLASKNLLLPRIDLLGRYRLKGFGHDLFGHGNELQRNGNLATQLDSSALGGLFNNDLQEWELGIDTTIPIGFRRQHSAVRHAQLNLAREKSILSEQQRQVIFGLSNAVGELRRASKVRSANRNRLEAANEQYAAILNIYREQDTTIDLVLEAQRRVIEAKLQHFQSQVEYMLAVKAIHFEQGTLLQYHNVLFGEAEASFANFDSVLSADAMSIEQPQFEYAPQTSEPANSTRPEFEPANQSSQQIEKNDSINDIDDALPKPKSDVGQPSSSSPKPDEPRSIIDRKINILDGAPNSGASKRDKKNPFRRNMFAPN